MFENEYPDIPLVKLHGPGSLVGGGVGVGVGVLVGVWVGVSDGQGNTEHSTQFLKSLLSKNTVCGFMSIWFKV